jgi:hypothetical protein
MFAHPSCQTGPVPRSALAKQSVKFILLLLFLRCFHARFQAKESCYV